MGTDEHTVTNPIYSGATITAINASTGQLIWQLSGYPSEWASTGSAFAVADGYITFFNGYDGQIYSVGKGPSTTTVQAPMTGITSGTTVAIQGTVTDISAGTQQAAQKAVFPSGVPVASDPSMKDWMAYVYQQQEQPTNFTGVTVTLTAIDSNNNLINIGSATTNMNGLYSYIWTPPNVSGKYTVTATFAGTNSYYPSNAQTTMVVQSAASPTTSPTATPTSVADMYFVPAIAGLFVLIIVVLAMLVLMMIRKRP